VKELAVNQGRTVPVAGNKYEGWKRDHTWPVWGLTEDPCGQSRMKKGGGGHRGGGRMLKLRRLSYCGCPRPPSELRHQPLWAAQARAQKILTKDRWDLWSFEVWVGSRHRQPQQLFLHRTAV
jgi:hypothetical protein